MTAGDIISVYININCTTKVQYRGRCLSQIWLFGGIERVSKKKCFFIPLSGEIGTKRDQETLLPLIKKFILPKTIIMSDSWGAYRNLKDHGYTHYMINHSENFVDPNQGEVHTQTIEREWRDVKEYIKRPGIKSEYLKQYLARYIFLKNNKKDPLCHFFMAAAVLNPHKTDEGEDAAE